MKNFLSFAALLICALIVAFGCEDKDDAHPKVETIEATPTSFNTSVFKGMIISNGSIKILDHGFVYSTSGEATVESGTKVSLGNKPAEGPFEANVNLNYPTQYYSSNVYVRAYLTNEKGTVYGKLVNYSIPMVHFNQVSPLLAKSGDKITITGNNLSSNKQDYEIRFNETLATVTEASKDKVIVEVPSEIIPYYSYYNIRITVKIAGYTHTVTEYFQVIPTATTFSPKSGSFGTPITIYGNNFRYNHTYVKIGDKTYSPNVINNNTITINVPNDVGQERFTIALTGENYSVELPGEFVMDPLTVTSISPVSGIAGNTVTIYGSNFNVGYYNQLNTVQIGTHQVVANYSAAGSITFIVPSGLNKESYPLTVFNGVHTVASTMNFEVVSPKITDFQPKTGSAGTIVTITGTNLKSDYYGYGLKFGTIDAWASEWTDTKITAYVPNGLSLGEMKLILNVAGEVVESAGNFKLLAPKITGFTPSSGTPGTRVFISGEGFSANKDYNRVEFGTVQTSIVSASSTSLEVLVPSVAAPGAMKISVIVDDKIHTSENNFTITQ